MLEVAGLHAGYGEIEILRNVSLAIGERQIVALVGANGAGKSTLVNTLSGVVPARRGRIRVDGEDITNAPPHRIVARGLVQVPEGRKLFGGLTVRDNLLLGATPARGARDREATLRDVFRLFPVLESRQTQLARTLSGGEQQMTAIGRALMARPRLLVLDEPSLGLAPKIVGEIFRVVGELNRAGLTVLLIEQNVRSSLTIADHAYVMENGANVLDGKGAALLAMDHVKRAYLGI